MTRFITNGDPTEISKSIGIANNMLFREANKGSVTRKIMDGVEVRINPGGINQVIITKPGREPVVMKKPAQDVCTVIYSYEGSKYGTLSALSRKDVLSKSFRYFGTEPAFDLTGVLDCNTILIMEPIRALTEKEAYIFNKLLSKGRNIFVFPGSDTASFNTVIDQLGSNLKLIPMTTSDTLMTTITADTHAKYRLIGRRYGFLHPKDENSLSHKTEDPLGVMMSTDDVIVMTPVFMIKSGEQGFTYHYGSELLSVLEYGETITWTRDSYIGEDAYPGDWSALSSDDIKAWLNTLEEDFFRMVPNDFVGYDTDSLGYLTYEERHNYDFMGAFAAVESGKSLYVHGYSPYWFLPEYEPDVFDGYTDIKDFCRWMENPVEVSSGSFGSFIPRIPFWYSYGGYYPPIQF